MGTVSGSDAAMKLLDVVRATLRTTFRPRCELRVPPFCLLDLRFVAKSSADYAECGYFGKAKFAVPGSAGRWPVVSGSLPETCKQSCLRITRSISASCRDEQASGLRSAEPANFRFTKFTSICVICGKLCLRRNANRRRIAARAVPSAGGQLSEALRERDREPLSLRPNRSPCLRAG